MAQLCISANIIFKRAFHIKIKFGRISRFRRIDFLVSFYRIPAIFEDNNKLFLLLSKSAITLINFFACFRKICDFGAFAHLFNNHGHTVESALFQILSTMGAFAGSLNISRIFLNTQYIVPLKTYDIMPKMPILVISFLRKILSVKFLALMRNNAHL